MRSPKMVGENVQIAELSTLENLQVFLDGKQKEVAQAHARRTKELEAVLAKEDQYFNALLE